MLPDLASDRISLQTHRRWSLAVRGGDSIPGSVKAEGGRMWLRVLMEFKPCGLLGSGWRGDPIGEVGGDSVVVGRSESGESLAEGAYGGI